jgi:hypothetical protein
MHFRHGAYYFVKRVGGKVVWRRLSADLSTCLELTADGEAEVIMSDFNAA